MGLLGHVEKAFADRQAAFFDSAIQVEQGFAQLIDLRQIGQVRAVTQRGQLIEQRAEFLSLTGMLTPAPQQVFGIEHDVHAFGQKARQQRGVTLDPQAAVRVTQHRREALIEQRKGSIDQLRRTRNLAQRSRVQLLQAHTQQRFSAAQHIEFGRADVDQVGFVFAHQLVKRAGQFGNRQHTRHVRAAFERVQCAQHRVADRRRRGLFGIVEKAAEGIQMPQRFLTENFQQLWIEHFAWRMSIGNRHRRRFKSIGQRVSAGCQQVDVVALALRVISEVAYYRGQQRQHFAHQLLHFKARQHVAFQHTVKQVFHRPGQLTEDQRAHHPAAALEGMKRPAHLGQCCAVPVTDAAERGEPARQILTQCVEDFVGLFQKDFAQFLVYCLFVRRRRQQAGGHIARRRVDRRHWAGEHLCNGLCRADQGLAVVQFQQFVLGDDLVEQRYFKGIRCGGIPQTRQALLGHVEDLIARRFVVFEHAFQVVLDPGDGVGQAVELHAGGTGFIHQQVFLNVFVAGGQQARRTRQRDHRQGTTNLYDQRAQRVEPLAVPFAIDVIEDHVLGLLQDITRFANHQLVNLCQVGGRQAAFFAARLFVAASHPREGRFDVQQRARDIHQRPVAGLTLPLRQTQHNRKLVDDHLARLAKAQHRQGIGDLSQRRQQGVELADMLAVATHEHIEPFLDPHQPFAQRHDHRAHGIAVRPGHARPLFIDHVVAGQGIGQCVLILEIKHLRRQAVGLGDVKQKAFQQFFRRRLIDARHALLGQPLEFLVGVFQQAAQRRAVGEVAVEHGLDQCRGDSPQRTKRCVFAQLLQPGEDLGHVTELGLYALLAHQARQRCLQGLAQLAQQAWQLRGIASCQFFFIKGRDDDQLRGEQAGFRKQAFTPRTAQVVE
ncbi:hypothetical protein ALQ16_203974 [Pseudomonas syringae pv. actinidiae]|nr:hypothetical protein ALQ16_203974 [Pseudomonas syringae pv. actinidiae]